MVKVLRKKKKIFRKLEEDSLAPMDVANLSIAKLPKGGNLRYKWKGGEEIEIQRPITLSVVSINFNGIAIQCQGSSFEAICHQIDDWILKLSIIGGKRQPPCEHEADDGNGDDGGPGVPKDTNISLYN